MPKKLVVNDPTLESRVSIKIVQGFCGVCQEKKLVVSSDMSTSICGDCAEQVALLISEVDENAA